LAIAPYRHLSSRLQFGKEREVPRTCDPRERFVLKPGSLAVITVSAEAGSKQSEAFEVMERRAWKAITKPFFTFG
jgi:hypothetical protein